MKKEKTNEHPLKEKAAGFPNKPGVYIFEKNKDPIYIGKAVEIKKRVLSYFRKSNTTDMHENNKVRGILSDADDLRYIIVESEKAALLLEANLIFEYKPKYNTFLKDNRFYPYIHITDEDFPRITLVRNRVGSGRFYGPFTSAKMVRQVMEIIYRTYGIRPCDYDLKRIHKPCLEYQLGRCSAPCTEISKEEYNSRLEKVENFLRGDIDSLKELLRERMRYYSGNLMFEKAAMIRDLLKEVDDIFLPQYIVLPDKSSRDFFALDILEGKATLIRLKSGAIFAAMTLDIDEAISLEEFFSQFYYGRKNDIPDRIITPFLNRDSAKYKALIGSDYFGPPESDAEKALMQMTRKNLEKELRSRRLTLESLKRLKTNLGLKQVPRTIEGIDIAHTQGLYTVASLVTFVNGKPDKTKYRRYRITTLDEPDDFEAMRIVMRRRYKKHPFPDLLLIDGGAGQVGAVKAVLEKELGLEKYDIIGLAKAEETIIFPDERGELKLKHNSPSLRVLVAVRDEAHRFANTFHSQLRDKRMGRSMLEDIPGVGQKRKMKLLKRFGSVRKIKDAGIDEIQDVVRNKKTSVLIKEYLQQNYKN